MAWIELPRKLQEIYLFREIAMFYIDNADKDLLIFALHNYNETYLKYYC